MKIRTKTLCFGIPAVRVARFAFLVLGPCGSGVRPGEFALGKHCQRPSAGIYQHHHTGALACRHRRLGPHIWIRGRRIETRSRLALSPISRQACWKPP